MFRRRNRNDGAGGGRFGRLSGWRRMLAYGGIGAVVVVVSLVAMIVLGANVDRLPRPGGGGASTAPASSSAPTAVEAPAGDSGHVTSSTGTDFGAGLPRLGSSPFARTKDPDVFAASVQAAVGYDYSTSQPTDAGVETRRITDEWTAGMTGEDGPLGAEIHRQLRASVTGAISPDEISYRIAAAEVDEVNVVGVIPTDNTQLREDAGNEIYLKVVQNRGTLYALTTAARIRTTVQQVGDVSGFTQTAEAALSLIVRCDPGVDEGYCELVGVIGGGSK